MSKETSAVETEYGSIVVDYYKCDYCGIDLTANQATPSTWFKLNRIQDDVGGFGEDSMKHFCCADHVVLYFNSATPNV